MAKGIVTRILAYAVLIVMGVLFVLPFVWMVLASLMSNNEIFAVPFRWIPEHWEFQHYVQIWSKTNMAVWLGNTVFFAVVVTVLQVFTGSFAAYGFSKIDFPGRRVLFMAYIATMAIPWQAYMIPQFTMLSAAGLNDTRWSIILLQAFGAFGVFMMKQFYDTVPDELCEAARLDGLSEFGIYRKIILPLSGPSLAALAIITFTNTWNDYMGPLLYLRSPDLYTIQLGLKTFISQYDADYAMIMTGSVLAVLPIVVVFLIGQKQFIAGIANTAIRSLPMGLTPSCRLWRCLR